MSFHVGQTLPDFSRNSSEQVAVKVLLEVPQEALTSLDADGIPERERGRGPDSDEGAEEGSSVAEYPYVTSLKRELAVLFHATQKV